MGLEKQGSKPSGITGRIIGRIMNRFHTGTYITFFKDRLPCDSARVLDIGCGGGRFLAWLAESNSTYYLYGLDHSEEMVSLAREVNKSTIKAGRCDILQGSVEKIEIENSHIDLVTAMETIQFWPDIVKSFREIRRVLKEGGQFIIINLYPKEGTKWWNLATLKNEGDYLRSLEEAGFSKISTDLSTRKGWIIATAMV